MDAIERLWNGRYGLAKTYWLWGVAAGLAWSIALSLIAPESPAALAAVCMAVAYNIVTSVGIWRAAGVYQGPKAWAILARVAVALGMAWLALMAVAVIASTVLPHRTPAPGSAQAPAAHGPGNQTEQPIDWEKCVMTPPPAPAEEQGPWMQYRK